MTTQYLTTSDEDLHKAAEIIKAGGLVAFPTETVYGLGGNALSANASRAIYQAKGRPSDNPLIVHIANIAEVSDIAMRFPENAQKLAKEIWPGPMTIVLPKFSIVPDETTGGLDTIAIRLPANETARKLIEYSGVPIAAPSANTSGRPSPTRWQHVQADLDGKIDAIIMGEDCFGGIESTIVDMTTDAPVILRPGLITPERIIEVLGGTCEYDDALEDPNIAPKAPGMKYKHYAPKADMRIYMGERYAVQTAIEDAYVIERKNHEVRTLIYDSAEEAAHDLFNDLRQIDDEGDVDLILAAALPSDDSIGYSVMNRMLKSAGYNIIEV